MENKECASRHIRQTVQACYYICRDAVPRPSDINAVQVEKHLLALTRSGKSARTVNSSLTAFRTFCNWLLKTDG